MKKNLPLFMFIAAFSLASCTHSRVIVTGNDNYPSLDRNTPIKVCLVEERIPNFEEIAIVEVYGDASTGRLHLDNAVDKAKGIARDYGANCVILLKDLDKQREHDPGPNYFYFRIGIYRGL